MVKFMPEVIILGGRGNFVQNIKIALLKSILITLNLVYLKLRKSEKNTFS